MHSRHSNLSLRCNNISGWQINSSSVSSQLQNFRIIESILFRENLLEKIALMLLSIDKYYWRYCINRISCVENGKSLNTEELVLQQNRLFVMQNELAIAIAHLRSISIRIIESVAKLREFMKKEIHLVNSVISVFWKNQNYLIKMTEDIQLLFEVQSVRYWIGFVPNPLMIPSTNHEPKEKWNYHIKPLFKHYFALHQEKQSRDSRRTNTSSRSGRKAAVQQDRKFIADNLNLISSMESSKTDSDLEKSSFFPSLFASAPAKKSSTTTSKTNSGFEDWEQLRDYCAYSWTRCKTLAIDWPSRSTEVDNLIENSLHGPVTTYTQSVDERQPSFFWSNGDHNPYVVEAALGFKEIFPSVFVVPPLPSDLLHKCLKLNYILEQERSITHEMEERKQHSLNLQSEFIAKKMEQKSTVSNPSENINLKFQLKHRQQSDSYSLFGIDSHFFSSSVHIEESQDEINAEDMPQLRTIKPMQMATDQDGDREISNPNYSPLFLTQESHSLYTQFEQNEEKKLVEEKLTASHSLVDMSQFKAFLLETSDSVVRQNIESKIDSMRKSTIKSEETGIVSLHKLYSGSSPISKNLKGGVRVKSCKRFSREFNRLDLKWTYQHARNIQRMIRGYLGRKRARKLKMRKKWHQTIAKIQAISRGFLLRMRAQRRLQQERIATFLIRKGAVYKFRASIIITQFIRKYVNLQKLKKNEPILYDKLNIRGDTVPRHQTFYKLKNAIDEETRQNLILMDSPYKNILLRTTMSPPSRVSRNSRRNSTTIIESPKTELEQQSNDEEGVTPLKSFSEFLVEAWDSPSKNEENLRVVSSGQNDGDNNESFIEELSADLPTPVIYRENALSRMTMDEEQKRKFQKFQAIALIKRLNEEKQVPDSMRESRLIPIKQPKQIGGSTPKKSKLSRKDKTFLKLEENPPTSLIQNPNDIFQPPIPKPLKIVENNPVNSLASMSTDFGTISHNLSASREEQFLSLSTRLQSKERNKRSVGFADSYANHANKVLAVKQEKEKKENEKFRGVLKKYGL
jgi:hypothetical protein